MLARSLAPAIALLLLVSCDGGDPADAGPPDGRADFTRMVLASIGANVIVPSQDDFVTAAAALEVATAAFAADPTDANRAAAQEAWRAAIDAWELVEVMQIGPAGMGGITTGIVGGMDVRDEIFTYEQTSACRIDQETVEAAHGDPELLAAELVNVRGLDALEYLLFVDTDENACSALTPINAEGTWAALGTDGVRAARATYAASAATLVSREAVRLQAAWAPTGGAHLTTLSEAGLDGNAYVAAQTALNELAGAMLYLDGDTRDMKLAEPAGIAGCLEATCPSALELPHAAHGGAAIAINMRAFAYVYYGSRTGADTLGWDDLLVETGNAALEVELSAAVEAAVAACDALGPSLQDAIATDMPAVMAAYDAISEVLRLFKGDVFTALDVQPSGPNDGDND